MLLADAATNRLWSVIEPQLPIADERWRSADERGQDLE
jgi:hypothetical protein